ncbi:putative membrane protein [Labrenzia sp. MBR-25]
MFDWAYKKRLKDDLELWVEKGWVSSAGAIAILKEQDQDDGRSRLPMALAGIGMVCVALALLAFIAANWGAIPKSVKLVGIVLLVVASNGLAALAASRGRKGIADLATGFATLVFLGGMALVGQIFHLPTDWPGGAFLVCLGALAAAWLTGSKTSLIVAAGAAITWQVMRSDFGATPLLEDLIGLLLLVAIFAHPVVHPARISRWAAISLLWVTYGRWFGETADLMNSGDDVIVAMLLAGTGGMAAAMMLIDPVADLFVKWSSDRPMRGHGHWLMARSLQDVGILVLSVLIVLALVLVPEVSNEPALKGLAALPALVPLAVALALLVAGMLLSYKTVKSGALFGATGLALVAVLMPVLSANILVLAAFVLAALIGLCALGTWYNNRFWMLCAYLGLTAVALWLLQVTIGSLLGQSLFFLVAGVLLLGMALWLARLMRRGGRAPVQADVTEEVQG